MSKRINAVALWLIPILVASASLKSDAQNPPSEAYPQLSLDAYEHLLDEVFSHEEPAERQLQYSLVLRFMTSRHAESEVVLFVLRNGTVQGSFFQVSGPSVWGKANDYVQKTGNADVQQIAKQVQTTRAILSVSPDKAGVLYSGLLRSIERSSTQLQQEMVVLKKTDQTTIFLDGSTYELWFHQGLTEVHWSVMDEEVDDVNPAGHAGLARWMNDVRRYSLVHAAR